MRKTNDKINYILDVLKIKLELIPLFELLHTFLQEMNRYYLNIMFFLKALATNTILSYTELNVQTSTFPLSSTSYLIY